MRAHSQSCGLLNNPFLPIVLTSASLGQGWEVEVKRPLSNPLPGILQHWDGGCGGRACGNLLGSGGREVCTTNRGVVAFTSSCRPDLGRLTLGSFRPLGCISPRSSFFAASLWPKTLCLSPDLPTQDK